MQEGDGVRLAGRLGVPLSCLTPRALSAADVQEAFKIYTQENRIEPFLQPSSRLSGVSLPAQDLAFRDAVLKSTSKQELRSELSASPTVSESPSAGNIIFWLLKAAGLNGAAAVVLGLLWLPFEPLLLLWMKNAVHASSWGKALVPGFDSLVWAPVALAAVFTLFSLIHGALMLMDKNRAQGSPIWTGMLGRETLLRSLPFFVLFLPYVLAPGLFFSYAFIDILFALLPALIHAGVDVRAMWREISPEREARKAAEILLGPAPGVLGVGELDPRDIFRAVADPSEAKAGEIVERSSIEERRMMSTERGAMAWILDKLGIRPGAAALIPLSAGLLARPDLIQMTNNALSIHGRVVFYVERGADVPQSFSDHVNSRQERAVIVRLPKGVKLFAGQDLMMAVMERNAPAGVADVHPFCPRAIPPTPQG
jgi:hypothetical protein